MPESPSNPHERLRIEKIARNQQVLRALHLPDASRELFPVRGFNNPKRVRNPKPSLPASHPRCSVRLTVVPKPNYKEGSPAQDQRTQLLTFLRKVDMTSDCQTTEQLNGSALGFSEVDGVWTHPDYGQDRAQAVMDYLQEEW